MTTVDWKTRAEAAERTVVVLKRKVSALYNGEGSSSVERQLERTQARQLEAVKRRLLLEVRASELAKHTRELEVEVATRTADLRAVLDNVTSGFFVSDTSLAVWPGHSRSCHELLDTDTMIGRSAVELLAAGDARMADALTLSLQQVCDDLLPEEVTLESVPKRIVVRGRILHLSVRTIRQRGVVEKLLWTLSDATLLETAQRHAEENRVLLEILGQKTQFAAFVSDAREMLAVMRAAIRDEQRATAARTLHTLKGNAAAFELMDLVETIHRVEGRGAFGREELDLVESTLRDFLTRHGSILRLDYDETASDTCSVGSVAADELRWLVAQPDVDLSALRRWTSRLGFLPAGEAMGPLSTYAVKLGERLGKEVSVTISGGDILVDARATRAVFHGLTHLVRNAVDHGIEEAEERLARGKPARGSISLVVTEDPETWTVRVGDDGRGILIERIVQAAVRRGVLSESGARKMTERELLEMIFTEGFSTSDVATDISGRGLGMSAIRSALHERRGTMSVETVPDVGTVVELRIPKGPGGASADASA